MSEQGFDTWILEVRGCRPRKRKGNHNLVGYTRKEGMSIEKNGCSDSQKNHSDSLHDIKHARGLLGISFSLHETLETLINKVHGKGISRKMIEHVSSSLMENSQLTKTLDQIKEQFASIFKNGPSPFLTSQIMISSEKLTTTFTNAQFFLHPHFENLQHQVSSSFAGLQKFTETIQDYKWNFDTYLQEDVPRAMEYIKNHSHSEDGKLLSVGHSLGGILLYGCIAVRAREHSDFAGVVTIGSALEYGVSNSSLKLLLPFADVVKALSGDFVPLDTLMAILYPLLVYPPYAFTWLGSHVSFGNMIEHDIYKKLLLTSFCAIPSKLLLQLSTVFQPGGLRNRDGTIKYKELLKHCEVPVLAIAGDKDLICPPQAVLDTVKALPQKMAVFKQFGDDNHHYGHYDLICGYLARKEVFPVIIDHLIKCDN